MATVDKDFRVKHGLVVEGTTATVNGEDILTTGSTISTSDLTEGTNLFFTEQRAVDAVTDEINTAVEDAIDAITTTVIEEGTNLYFTNQRALDATSAAYDPAGAAATAQSAAEDYADGLASNYDVAGAASTVQTNLDNHALDTSTHGVTGAIVGTTDTQTLTNKTIDTASNSITVVASDVSDFNTAALSATASAYDAAGAAAAAQSAAEDYADGLAVNYDAAGAASTVQGNLDDHTSATSAHGVSGNVVGTSDAQTLTNKTMGDDLLMDGNQISGLGTPTQADHAATKSYVDAVSEGLHIHEAARVATVGNVAIATALENGDVLDGITLATGDRVLVKNQTTASQNGIYVVQASGQALRATDFDTALEVDSGDFIFVTSGTYANTGWVQTLKPATIGTDPISFTQFSGAGTFLAGNGLELNGNTFEIDDTITATRTFASSEASAAQTAAEEYADGLAVNYDAAGSAATAEQNAKDYADTNFVLATDLPGQLDDYVPLTQKGAADGVATLDGNGKVPASQLDLDVSGDIQDAIDALTTSDIEEGTNLYFTDQRAIDALDNTTPTFTAVDINSIAKQVVATASAANAGLVGGLLVWEKADYATAKLIVKAETASESQVSEVLLTIDAAGNVAMTEFAMVQTDGELATIDVITFGPSARLNVTTLQASTTVTVYGTLLA